MFEIYRPTKDATIYGYAKRTNAGIDEVVELNTQTSMHENQYGDFTSSRILMDFPEIDGDFNAVIEDGPNAFGAFGYKTTKRNPTGSATGLQGNTLNLTLQDVLEDASSQSPNAFAFFGQKTAPKRKIQEEQEPEELEKNGPSIWLRLWFANGQGLPKKYTVEAFPVTQEWVEGRGREENEPPTKEPVNWIERREDKDWEVPGGTYLDIPRSSESFNGDDPDVYMNANSVFSQGVENGIILKRKDEDFNRLTQLKFFSSETRTIYVPHVLVGRDEYEFNTKNAEPFDHSNFSVYVADLQETYNSAKTRFKVTVREQYKQRDFLGIRPTDRISEIEKDKYLPERSLMWKIVDENTGVVFFPFDERYSAVSFDGQTHYFDVDLNNLLPKRKYKIVFKFKDPKTGNEKFFDRNQTFKIE